jgi:hypothetical protein
MLDLETVCGVAIVMLAATFAAILGWKFPLRRQP